MDHPGHRPGASHPAEPGGPGIFGAAGEAGDERVFCGDRQIRGCCAKKAASAPAMMKKLNDLSIKKSQTACRNWLF